MFGDRIRCVSAALSQDLHVAQALAGYAAVQAAINCLVALKRVVLVLDAANFAHCCEYATHVFVRLLMYCLVRNHRPKQRFLHNT